MEKVDKKKVEKALSEKKELADLLKKNKTLLENLESVMRQLRKEQIDFLNFLKREFKENSKMLSTTAHSVQHAEDALLNVLLAIRQNEYLQAYYPAQKGHPEMRVTGTHPVNLEKK